MYCTLSDAESGLFSLGPEVLLEFCAAAGPDDTRSHSTCHFAVGTGPQPIVTKSDSMGKW